MVAGSQLVVSCLSLTISQTHTHTHTQQQQLPHRSCLCAAVACLPQHTHGTAKHSTSLEPPSQGNKNKGQSLNLRARLQRNQASR